MYDNRATYPDIIRPAFLPGLDEARSRDRQARTSKKTYFRQTVIKLLDDTNPSANNCPLDMKNVTYTIVATYLSSIKTSDGLFKGMSTYDGARSSIMHLMKEDNVYPPPEYKEKVCNLLKGFRRTIQQQKVDNGESLVEGKDPISFSGHYLLCKTFLENNGPHDEFLFSHCFLTLE